MQPAEADSTRRATAHTHTHTRQQHTLSPASSPAPCLPPISSSCPQLNSRVRAGWYPRASSARTASSCSSTSSWSPSEPAHATTQGRRARVSGGGSSSQHPQAAARAPQRAHLDVHRASAPHKAVGHGAAEGRVCPALWVAHGQPRQRVRRQVWRGARGIACRAVPATHAASLAHADATQTRLQRLWWRGYHICVREEQHWVEAGLAAPPAEQVGHAAGSQLHGTAVRTGARAARGGVYVGRHRRCSGARRRSRRPRTHARTLAHAHTTAHHLHVERAEHVCVRAAQPGIHARPFWTKHAGVAAADRAERQQVGKALHERGQLCV